MQSSIFNLLVESYCSSRRIGSFNWGGYASLVIWGEELDTRHSPHALKSRIVTRVGSLSTIVQHAV